MGRARGAGRDVFVGRSRRAARGAGRARSARPEHGSGSPGVPDGGRTPEADERAGAEQAAFESTGERHPFEHGHDRDPALAETLRLREGTARLGVIEPRKLQRLGYELSPARVDLGGQAQQPRRGSDSAPHRRVTRLRRALLETSIPHAGFPRGRLGRGLEHRPAPKLAGFLPHSRLRPLRRRGSLSPKGSEPRWVDGEVPPVHPAPQHTERIAGARLAWPPVMPHQATGLAARGCGFRAAVDPPYRPQRPVAVGHVGCAEKPPARVVAPVVRKWAALRGFAQRWSRRRREEAHGPAWPWASPSLSRPQSREAYTNGRPDAAIPHES